MLACFLHGRSSKRVSFFFWRWCELCMKRGALTVLFRTTTTHHTEAHPCEETHPFHSIIIYSNANLFAFGNVCLRCLMFLLPLHHHNTDGRWDGELLCLYFQVAAFPRRANALSRKCTIYTTKSHSVPLCINIRVFICLHFSSIYTHTYLLIYFAYVFIIYFQALRIVEKLHKTCDSMLLRLPMTKWI